MTVPFPSIFLLLNEISIRDNQCKKEKKMYQFSVPKVHKVVLYRQHFSTLRYMHLCARGMSNEVHTIAWTLHITHSCSWQKLILDSSDHLKDSAKHHLLTRCLLVDDDEDDDDDDDDIERNRADGQLIGPFWLGYIYKPVDNQEHYRKINWSQEKVFCNVMLKHR